MDALEHLSEEHRLITTALDAFEQYVERAERGEPVDRDDLEQFVVFFREYVDLSHHDKEESILLPALVRVGFHWDDGALLRVRREHDQERYLARSLRHVALQVTEWSADDRRRFISVARELIAFQRAHIDREERLLFPSARARLSDEMNQQIADDFSRLDQERLGDAAPPRLRALVDRLIGSYRRAG